MSSATTATKPSFGIDEDNLAAWRAFLRAHSLMLRRLGRDLDEAGLPPLPWYDVLAALSEAEGGRLRQVELAERVTISVSGLSRLIDRIARDGLVRRTTSESDRRSFFVELTDEGEEMLGRMWPVYARGVADDFLPALGSNPCEIRAALESIASTCEKARRQNGD